MPLVIEQEAPPLRTSPQGVVLVGNTRVPLDTVIWAYRAGHRAEEIVEMFDTLKLEEVYAVIAYYLRHRDEVDAYLAQQETESRQIQREAEAKPEYQAMRERWQERKQAFLENQTNPSGEHQ